MDLKVKNSLIDTDGSRIDIGSISIESLGSHLLFGEINEETIKSAIEFIIKCNKLYADERDLSLFINSTGGNVSDGFALIDMMNISRLNVKTIGLGNIMSMGVLLLAAGTPGKRIITKNCQVMAHQFSSGVEGKFHEVLAAHKADLYLEQQFLTHFKNCTKMTEKQIKDILLGPSDRWLTPIECKKYGIVDHIVDQIPKS